MRQEIQIATADGSCRTLLCVPDGASPREMPGVILYMDAPGYRPTLWDHAEKLAQLGYVVIAPDLFYRQGPYAPHNAGELMMHVERRNAWLAERMYPYNSEQVLRDTDAFVAFLKARGDVKPAFGVSGYCMGGAMAMRAAAAYPDLIKACASYHGGNLATEDANSAHLLVPKIKAEMFFGVATNDFIFPPEQEARLEAALKGAGSRYTMETIPAAHGFTFPDSPAFTPEAGARQWQTMTDLFARNLK